MISRPRQPPSFFLKGAVALLVILLATLLMGSSPELDVLRALIVGGLVIAVGKMLLRYYNVDWPPRRN